MNPRNEALWNNLTLVIKPADVKSSVVLLLGSLLVELL
jgi:hypothetical protein